jgi:hypothetical protein
MAKKNTDDLRAYWQEIANKNGLDPETTATMLAALGNEAVARTFRQAFVAVPDHHSRLDEVKSEYDSRKAELDDWYKSNALPAYQTNLAGIERLHQYEAAYGELEPGATTRQDANNLGFNSKADLDKYLDDRLRAERAGNIGLMKSIPKMTVDYLHRFGEVLDTDEVEKISVKQGLPPDLAYERYIAPKVEAKRQSEYEEKLKAAREEGARDAISKYHLPVDTTPRESSPFYERLNNPEAKPMGEAEEDRAARSEFLKGWNDYAETVANKHRP